MPACRTGWMFSELLMWHDPGQLGAPGEGLEPVRHHECVETKRRLASLLAVSGLADSLVPIRARPASEAELGRVHTRAHIEFVQACSRDSSKRVHVLGDEASMSAGGYEVAALAAGGALALTDACLDGAVTNGYALTRPPGHHATPDAAMGFCVFNNIAIAAKHALEARGLQRVAIVDFDVHHGNGSQAAFWRDERVLFISLHQDSNYPLNSGGLGEVGEGPGRGFTINVPLPPGSGSGAYRAAFDRIVAPALDAFAPQLILVSAGYDAAFLDPLSAQMCSSEDFRYFAAVLKAAAQRHCGGRLLAFHEGGYSALYVPFCGLAFLEELAGLRTGVADPELASCQGWGYQALQPWQDAVVAAVQAGPLALLQAAAGARPHAKEQ